MIIFIQLSLVLHSKYFAFNMCVLIIYIFFNINCIYLKKKLCYKDECLKKIVIEPFLIAESENLDTTVEERNATAGHHVSIVQEWPS